MPPVRPFHALFSRLYYDVGNPAGFSGPEKLYLEARKHDDRVRKRDAEKWLQYEKSYTLYRKSNSNIPRRKVLARGPHYQYQADLLDYSALWRDNYGYRFLLVIIDCFSRYGLAIPIKRKSKQDVVEAFRRAFTVMLPPQKLQTDKGTEFYNDLVQNYLREQRVHHFSTDQELKAQIVERFNRTLRSLIKRVMCHHRTLRYVDHLPDVLYGYNNRVHSSIKPFTPAQVNPLNRDDVHYIQYGAYLREPPMSRKFAVGDVVRIATNIRRVPFRKAYKHKTFSDELFTVHAIKHDYNPPMYQLRDSQGRLIPGPFYEDQMQRVEE